MPTYDRRSHERRLASGRAVRVSKHQVTNDGRRPFIGNGSSGSIARGNASLSLDGSIDNIIRLDRIELAETELASEKPDSLLVPNAVCPVCGAVVFFYSNSAGAAVFFDDVGKPWPKHPCTDRTLFVSDEISVRPRARDFAISVTPGRPSNNRRRVLQVVKYKKFGLTNYIELADPRSEESVGEWKTKEGVSFERGQIVIVEDNSLSYISDFSAEVVIADGTWA